MKRLILYILLISSFASNAQLKAVILHRAGSGETMVAYWQDAGINPNGEDNAVFNFKHGAGEVATGAPGDTTTSAGLPKLKNAGTGPTAQLATMMVPHYTIPGTSTEIWIDWFAAQIPNGHTLWEDWMDSLSLAFIKAQPHVNKKRIYGAGLSLGGGGQTVTFGHYELLKQYAFISPCCLGYWSSSLNSTTYDSACRNLPPTIFWHANNDPTAAVTLSINIVNTLNATMTKAPLKGPLNTITLYVFSGNTAGTSGHQIWGVVFAFTPTNLNYELTSGQFWKFDMTIYQKALAYTRELVYRPDGY